MSFGINAYSYKGAQLKDLQQLSYEKQSQYLKTDAEVEGIRTTNAYVIEVLECTILEGTIKEDVSNDSYAIRFPCE